MRAKVAAHNMDLIVLRVHNVQHHIGKLRFEVWLLMQHQLRHIHRIHMVRDHLLAKGGHIVPVRIVSGDPHLAVHLAAADHEEHGESDEDAERGRQDEAAGAGGKRGIGLRLFGGAHGPTVSAGLPRAQTRRIFAPRGHRAGLVALNDRQGGQELQLQILVVPKLWSQSTPQVRLDREQKRLEIIAAETQRIRLTDVPMEWQRMLSNAVNGAARHTDRELRAGARAAGGRR